MNHPVAYEGSEPYIFVSYAHKDSDTVLPIIAALQEQGFRVWYDAGIEAGTEWPEYIAEHLNGCTAFIAFMSNHAAESHNCRREINFAIELKKEPLVVYLTEQVNLSLGMRMQLGTLHAMFYSRHSSMSSFIQELTRSRILASCQGAAEKAGKTEAAGEHQQYRPGDIITFGSYPQSESADEDIEWIVLERKGSRILVISKYALDCQQYHTSNEDITWETCSLRKWLNNDFLRAAFYTSEQAKIPTVTVTPDENPYHSTDPGRATQDKIFLLSIPEAQRYFFSDEARMCVPTAHAIKNGAYTNKDYTVGGAATCWWWLRTPGCDRSSAASINLFGGVYAFVNYVNNDTLTVRPALWIDLDA